MSGGRRCPGLRCPWVAPLSGPAAYHLTPPGPPPPPPPPPGVRHLGPRQKKRSHDGVRGFCLLPLTGDVSFSLAQLAKCGDWGNRPSNIERDLHRFADKYLPVAIAKLWIPSTLTGETVKSWCGSQSLLHMKFLQRWQIWATRRFRQAVFPRRGYQK